MNAVRDIERPDAVGNNLKPPFDNWSDKDLLTYFQQRRDVHYFAIVNGDETTQEKIDGILSGDFDFNGECHRFDGEIDWLHNPSSDIEWAIMLHKFYYAPGLGMAYQRTRDARYAEAWMKLSLSWMDSVPPGFLSADVTGRRVQNWLYAYYYFVSVCQAPEITPDFHRNFLNAIHEQVTFLCHNLTPARNHRTLELYTIFLAAVVFPEFKEGGYWLDFSCEQLQANILSDILPDGVHCELSTDYHHIVLRNFLAVKRLATLNQITLPPEFDDRLQLALTFSQYAHKPDGTIPSLSDGDTGCFLDLLEQGYDFYGNAAFRYVATQGLEGAPPTQRCRAFSEGGYFILRSGWGESGEPYEDERYLIFDCGPVGAGNHGHLDLLNVEMAAYGQSLVVDPGRYTYDESGEINWRVKFRGTAYHNTVLVDGLNQTRYEFHKTKFKITGEHPHFKVKDFVSTPKLDYVHGLAISREYTAVHERKILFVDGGYWLICDRLSSPEEHAYDLLFHLSVKALNQVETLSCEAGTTIASPQLLLCQPFDPGSQVVVDAGYVSSVYGSKQAAPIIRFSRHALDHCFYTLLYPFKQQPPRIALRQLNVSGGCRPVSTYDATALEIRIEQNGESRIDRIYLSHRPGQFNANDRTFGEEVVLERAYTNANGDLHKEAYSIATGRGLQG
jgi:Heparinase II/III N-terminus/Heparinase II/III-like protein